MTTGMTSGVKKDRTARLVKVVNLLYQNPHGLTPQEIANLCDVCVRTTYRDLAAIHDELKATVWQDGSRYGLAGGFFLPPIGLTLLEAVALFISTRLTSKYADERDPNVVSAFIKLVSVLPQPIAQHVQETVNVLADKPRDDTYVRVFAILTEAWARQRRVRIFYQHGDGGESSERLLDPYFIEPSGIGHACYVIGHDHKSGELRTFKIERIRDIELTDEEFVPQEGWTAAKYLQDSWGIVHDEVAEVVIRFSARVSSRVKETVWHASQVLEDEPGGGLLFKVKVSGTMEITPWILSWGAEAEVLSPESLRQKLTGIASQMAEMYGQRLLPAARR